MVALSPIFISSACAFAQHAELERLLSNEILNEFMIELMGILIFLAEFDMAANIFRTNMTQLIVSISMNLLKTT